MLPTSLEITYRDLFDEILRTADLLIDYHNAWIGSISFSFRDRVLYRAGTNDEAAHGEAQALADRQGEMLAAYGHTIINEYPTDKYIEKKLHRSTSGAALLVGRFPAMTVELGTGLVSDPSIISASVAGTRNLMQWAGMLNSEPKPIGGTTVVNPAYKIPRMSMPRVCEACVIQHLVEPGETVVVGQPVARQLDIWGHPWKMTCFYPNMKA